MIKRCILAACLGLAPLTLHVGNAAAIPLTTGNISFAGAEPSSLYRHAAESDDHIQLYSERLNHTLTSDVTLDGGGVLSAGTVVNSYILHLDPVGTGSGEDLTLTGSVTFDSSVLGVIGSTADLIDTDTELGLPGTTFWDLSPRGVELDDSFTISGAEITDISLSCSRNLMDEMRVLTTGATTVPEPGAMAILGLGLIGFGINRRRKW